MACSASCTFCTAIEVRTHALSGYSQPLIVQYSVVSFKAANTNSRFVITRKADCLDGPPYPAPRTHLAPGLRLILHPKHLVASNLQHALDVIMPLNNLRLHCSDDVNMTTYALHC